MVHAACTYGGPGGWSYTEKGAGIETVMILTGLNATSQSFFMGMFFFISAYFTHISFRRKGLWLFMKDRIIRLVIPLLLTIYFINVLTIYLSWPVKHPQFADLTFAEIWKSGNAFGVGVMWFVETLIYFTALYLLVSRLFPSIQKDKRKKYPKITPVKLAAFAVFLGIITFLVRIKYPLFQNHYGLNFDLGHFPQYIFMFIFGIMAARNSSLNLISFEFAKKWMWLVIGMIVIVFPLLFFIGEAFNDGIKPFVGGFGWRAFVFAIWEQFTGISIMAVLLGISAAKWNKQNNLAKLLSNSAYAVYVLHPPVLVGVSILLATWNAHLMVKFLVVAPLALLGSFGTGILMNKIPVLKRIF